MSKPQEDPTTGWAWDPDRNRFMKPSLLFDGQWEVARPSVWDADNPFYRYDPKRHPLFAQAKQENDEQCRSVQESATQLDATAQAGLSGWKQATQPQAGTRYNNAAKASSPTPAVQPVTTGQFAFGKTNGSNSPDSLEIKPKNVTFVLPENKENTDPYGFNRLLAETFEIEGGYSDRKSDRGGATNRGIAWKTWENAALRLLGKEPTTEHLKNLTREEAAVIYYHDFWLPSRAQEINDGSIRRLYFDFRVNSRPQTAIRNLQKAINQTGGNVKEDAIFGDETIRAVNDHPHPERLFEQYKKNRKEHYFKILEADANQNDYINGWLNRLERFTYNRQQ